jgi:hypothetical protein
MDSPPPHDLNADSAPTRGAILASILECPFRPAAAARRTLYGPLRTAWLVHLSCALGALLVVLVVIAATETDVPADYLDYQDSVLNVLGIFFNDVAEYPFPTLAIVLAIELGYAALALWLLPWGACDEPIKESLRHALRRVWMQSPQLLLFFVIAGGATAYLYQTHQEWMHAYGHQRPVYPVPPPGTTPGTPQWDQYNAQVTVFWEETRRISREEELEQPFHVRFGQPIIGVNCFLWAMVFLASLLRSAGALRPSRPAERQPLCDACGYDLTTMPMESRCPECGDSVLASLGPDARPGPPWTDSRLGVVTAWFRTWRQAIFSPTAFGRSIRVTEPGTSHRVFFLMHLPVVFLIAACTPPAIILSVEGHLPDGQEWAVVLFLGPAAGCICVAAATSVMLKSAAWAGWYHWWKLKRNLLPATIQVSCYLVVYLVVWEFLGGVSGVLAIFLANHEPFTDWFQGTRAHPEAILTFAWFAVNFLCLGVYANIVKRAVASTRFANR